jgi:hypothetical protein
MVAKRRRCLCRGLPPHVRVYILLMKWYLSLQHWAILLVMHVRVMFCGRYIAHSSIDLTEARFTPV